MQNPREPARQIPHRHPPRPRNVTRPLPLPDFLFHRPRCIQWDGFKNLASYYALRRSPMPAHRRWFDRRFELGLPPEAIPEIIERLRGTPARLEERLPEVPPDVLIERYEGKWSIQENAVHLFDIEPLWEGRLDDLLAGSRELRS